MHCWHVLVSATRQPDSTGWWHLRVFGATADDARQLVIWAAQRWGWANVEATVSPRPVSASDPTGPTILTQYTFQPPLAAPPAPPPPAPVRVAPAAAPAAAAPRPPRRDKGTTRGPQPRERRIASATGGRRVHTRTLQPEDLTHAVELTEAFSGWNVDRRCSAARLETPHADPLRFPEDWRWPASLDFGPDVLATDVDALDDSTYVDSLATRIRYWADLRAQLARRGRSC